MASTTRSSLPLPTATWTKRGEAWVNRVAGVVAVGDTISSQARGKAAERRVVTKVLETTDRETIVVSEPDKAKPKTASASAPNTTKATSRVDVLTAGICEGTSLASKTPGRVGAPPREWLDKIGHRWVSKHSDPAFNGKRPWRVQQAHRVVGDPLRAGGDRSRRGRGSVHRSRLPRRSARRRWWVIRYRHLTGLSGELDVVPLRCSTAGEAGIPERSAGLLRWRVAQVGASRPPKLTAVVR